MWDPILEVLERKAKAGLDVRVMYDDLGCMIAAQHQVEDAAEHRHQQDGDDPGNLVGGVAAVVDDVQHRRHADGDADGVEVDEILLEPQQHHQQDSQLGQDGQDGCERPEVEG